MAFITLGTSAQLQIKVPSEGDTDWASVMQTDTFQKIAEHDHTGSGTGAQIATGGLAADAVTGAKIRLDNNENLRARNAADSANVNIVKLDTNDDSYFTATISRLTLKNASYLTGRNAADGADVNIARVDSSDNAIIVPHTIQQANSVTLADNQSATSASVITLASNESCKIHYRIVRSTDVQSGVLELEESNSVITDEFIGDDTGITFSINSGDLEYASSSTGNTGAFTYIIIKK